MSQNPEIERIDEALAKHQSGDFQAARQAYEDILRSSPDHPEASHLLGLLYHQEGDNEKAAELVKIAVDAQPDNPSYLYNFGVVLQKLDQNQSAEECYRKVTSLDSTNVSAWVNLGNILSDSGRPGEAVECHRNALNLQPNSPEHHHRLARSLRVMGDIDNAISHLGLAAALAPNDHSIQSELLFSSQYQPDITIKELARRHQAWAANVEQAPLLSELSEKSGDRLKIGFLSPDLGNHPVGIFMAPLLERLRDHARIETFCFHDSGKNDEFSQRNRSNANQWIEVLKLDDETLFSTIKEANLDVLIELTGHTENNRLLVVAKRPAPIQITWAGYVGSTGLEAIDYLITDHFQSPDGFEEYCSETLLRFPNDYICYEAPGYAPEVTVPPLFRNGFPTFGCLNNPSKLSTSTISVWSELMRNLPESRLILKYKGMDDRAVMHRILGQFAANGVNPTRIEMLGGTQHRDHLETFSRIDLALDPMPYSGGLSTCEAIWMGVPVITLPGETFASRHSLSHLSNAGLEECVAESREDYLAKASEIVSSPEKLSELRMEMRNRVSQSPLCDLNGLAQDFVSAMKIITKTS